MSRSVIALTESCGTGKTSHQDILAFDPAGHLLVHVTGLYSFNPSLGHDALVFRGLLSSGFEQTAAFRYDLVTGSLARLSPPSKATVLAYPQAAGDYVLWYDKNGGHVASPLTSGPDCRHGHRLACHQRLPARALGARRRRAA